MKYGPLLPWNWLPAPNLRPAVRTLAARTRREQQFDAPQLGQLGDVRELTKQEARRQPMTPARPLDRVERLATSNTPIRLGDRWAIYGTSGTGKTTFDRHLLARYMELFPETSSFIFDTNASRPWSRLPGIELYQGLTPPQPPMRSGVIMVWAPPMDDPDAYERALESIFYCPTPIVTVVDELSSLARSDSPLSYPRGLKLLYKQGRSGFKTTLTNTQDAAFILRQLLGQASHIVRFRLQLPSDSWRINPYYARGPELGERLSAARRDEVVEPRHQWGFWHVRNDQPASAREYLSWRQFL